MRVKVPGSIKLNNDVLRAVNDEAEVLIGEDRCVANNGTACGFRGGNKCELSIALKRKTMMMPDPVVFDSVSTQGIIPAFVLGPE